MEVGLGEDGLRVGCQGEKGRKVPGLIAIAYTYKPAHLSGKMKLTFSFEINRKAGPLLTLLPIIESTSQFPRV
jgi:hypothetical protein